MAAAKDAGRGNFIIALSSPEPNLLLGDGSDERDERAAQILAAIVPQILNFHSSGNIKDLMIIKQDKIIILIMCEVEMG